MFIPQEVTNMHVELCTATIKSLFTWDDSNG